MSDRPRDFDSDGVSIRYRAKGTGRSVVLLHGFIFSIGPAWIDGGFFDALSQHNHVVALDLRGHGHSGKPHDPNRYGLEMIEDVLRLMDHLEVDRAHVMGYSLGGILACKLLEIASDRLRSVVLGGAAAVYEGDDIHRSWLPLAEMLERVRPGETLTSHFWPNPTMRPPREVQEIVDANEPAALAGVARGMLDVAIKDQVLRNNRVPMLAVCGERDPVRASVLAMKRIARAMTVQIVPGHDHHTLPASNEFREAVSAFIARTN